MTRDEQIRKVERGFAELIEFAADSWSNLAIVAKARALRAEVVSLYLPVAPEATAPKPALKRRQRRATPANPPPPRRPIPAPESFEPVQVDENTRWG